MVNVSVQGKCQQDCSSLSCVEGGEQSPPRTFSRDRLGSNAQGTVTAQFFTALLSAMQNCLFDFVGGFS